MARLALVAALAWLIAGSSAEETIWSSVAYILHGERTPLRSAVSSPPTLTPLGAQQLFAQGTALRARWLDRSLTAGQSGITGFAPIMGLETNAIDNSQLDIRTTTDEYVISSAMAFMQALYPPRNQTFLEMESAVLANHTLVDFPLSGYQYPRIQTLSPLDPDSAW